MEDFNNTIHTFPYELICSFLFAKSIKNIQKQLQNENSYPWLIWRDYFFRVKRFWNITVRPSTLLFSCPWYIWKVKFFYTPRTFGFSCPWLSGRSFLKKFSEIPQQKHCNFPIIVGGLLFFPETPRQTICKCPIYSEENFSVNR